MAAAKKQTTSRWREALALVAVFLGGVVYVVTAPEYTHPLRANDAEAARMLFVGDVMLARNVEGLADRHGLYYPFSRVRDLFDTHEIVVANFEGAIPEVHTKTPSRVLRFSVREEFADVLARVGVTAVTLANNHAQDYGAAGYDHTRTALDAAGVGTLGTVKGVSTDEVLEYELDGRTLSIIPINTIFGAPSRSELEEVFASLQSDVQVVCVHWGVEYASGPRATERTLAHTLIDLGADVVIGHHPHVVQSVEEYRGVPIFYSLGNFIFDQYWNDAVTTGLALSLSLSDTEIRYELVPVTSADMRSAPRPMERSERTRFLHALASRSDETLADALREGVLTQIYAFAP